MSETDCTHEMDRGSSLRFDGMTWPNPDDPAEVQWRLRCGDPCKHDLLAAAQFMHAYAHLVGMPGRERDQRVRQIRDAAATTAAPPTPNPLPAASVAASEESR